MKKIILSFGFIAVFSAYALHERNESSRVPVVLPRVKSISSPVPSMGVSATTQPSSVSTAPSMTRGQYRDGSYIGDPADAYYGNIQVKALIQGGKITDVQFLQYPNDRDTSIQVNSQAMPYLKQEAIQAQNAQVDIVSGATDSSQAFIQSLQSALDKAKV